MKYIDHQSIGLEQLLMEKLSVLIELDDLSDGELKKRVHGLSGNVLWTLDNMIRVNLSIMRDEQPEAYDMIPEELRKRYASKDTGGAEKRTYDFLSWFSGMRLANVQARTNRAAELNNFCSRICGAYDEQSMTRTFFGLNNQRVIAVRSGSGGDEILLEAAEREWGRSVFRFTGCSNFNEAFLPLPGYLYGFEGIADDGGFHVRMLVDSSFGKDEYPARLISRCGWHEFGFDCRGITPEPVFYDYAGRMQRLGTPRFELIERCCALLVSKYEILGKDALTDSEKDMLSAAQLMRGASALINRDDSDPENHFRYLILEALDNRYASRRLCDLLGQCGCEKLKKLLGEAMDSFDGDDTEAAILSAQSFWGQLETEVAQGSARPLLSRLSEMFTEMTSTLPQDPLRSRLETELIDRVKLAASPELEKMGFSGSYPHYFRERKRKMDYISFMIDTSSDKPHHGTVSYYASVAAAQMPIEQHKKLEQMGVPSQAANALDCLPENIGLSRYGELAGASDSQYVRLNVSLYKGGSVTLDESPRLGQFVKLAESQFKRGRIPMRYRRMRLRAGASRGAALRSLAICAPVGVFAAIGLLLLYNFWLRDQSFYMLSKAQSAAAALAGGLIASGITAGLRNLICSFRLWRY